MPVDTQPARRRSQPASQGHERGVHLVDPTTQDAAAGIRCTGVSPRLTEWLPEVLEQLRAVTSTTIRTVTDHTDPWRVSASILDVTLPGWHTLEESWDDATAEAVAYTQAIAELALSEEATTTTSTYHERRHADLTSTVESVGTGRGAVNAGLGALAKGPVALHRELVSTPHAITLALDGPAWRELADRRTGVRALAAIAVLAAGFDVRVVVSPALQRELTRRYPRWCAIHLGLTQSRDRSPSDEPHAWSQQSTTDESHPAWTAVEGLARTPGKRRLLDNLAAATGRSYRDLEHDHAVDLEAGTISRYVLDLEARGLVTVDRRGTQHAVTLSPLGETAVTAYLDADADLVHPTQQRLPTDLTTTTHDCVSTVSPRRGDSGDDAAPSPDAWLAATGDPDADGDATGDDGNDDYDQGDGAYVQWLTGPETVSEAQLHRRFSTVAQDGSVTLVDDACTAFDDGRVAYLSHTAEEAHVLLQWGGPLATLGRLAGALLSEKALSKILTPSRCGRAFEAIHDGDIAVDAPRVLRRGHQVGWLSDAEATYEAWRERITSVRDSLLARVATHASSDDRAARSSLFKDLHGVIASATQLYHASGVDLTTTIRLPDTASLTRHRTRRRELCTFLAKTVPKQSTYGVHSGYRMLFEDRPEKLRRRLPYEVTPDATMDLTMSWVLAGPTATTLRDAIQAALEAELETVREAIADGTEAAPQFSIPVVDGTTYPAIRRVIDAVATRQDVPWTPGERQRLVRLCLRSFGPADTTRRSCPYDVIDSLLRAVQTAQHPTVPAVERAAATLPRDRFRPDLVPTATALYATLVTATEPLGRSTLIERADIAASSYDRRIGAVQALPRVHAVQVDGHRRWCVAAAPRHSPPPVTPSIPQPRPGALRSQPGLTPATGRVGGGWASLQPGWRYARCIGTHACQSPAPVSPGDTAWPVTPWWSQWDAGPTPGLSLPYQLCSHRVAAVPACDTLVSMMQIPPSSPPASQPTARQTHLTDGDAQ